MLHFHPTPISVRRVYSVIPFRPLLAFKLQTSTTSRVPFRYLPPSGSSSPTYTIMLGMATSLISCVWFCVSPVFRNVWVSNATCFPLILRLPCLLQFLGNPTVSYRHHVHIRYPVEFPLISCCLLLCQVNVQSIPRFSFSSLQSLWTSSAITSDFLYSHLHCTMDQHSLFFPFISVSMLILSPFKCYRQGIWIWEEFDCFCLYCRLRMWLWEEFDCFCSYCRLRIWLWEEFDYFFVYTVGLESEFRKCMIISLFIL